MKDMWIILICKGRQPYKININKLIQIRKGNKRWSKRDI